MHMLHVRRSVPTFQNLAKQNKFQAMFSTGETVGLADWIVDPPGHICGHYFHSRMVSICRPVKQGKHETKLHKAWWIIKYASLVFSILLVMSLCQTLMFGSMRYF